MTSVQKEREEMKKEDKVEIVRCKDCKYSSSNGLYGCYLEYFELEKDYIGRLLSTNGVRMYSDDFCSRGERR